MRYGLLLMAVAFVCMPGLAHAQLSTRCTSDDKLTPAQVPGRNGWARKCGYISPAREAMLNSEGEYEVFSNGCFKQPCAARTANCTYFVPASESAPCITGLIRVGTCMAEAVPAFSPGSLLARYTCPVPSSWQPNSPSAGLCGTEPRA